MKGSFKPQGRPRRFGIKRNRSIYNRLSFFTDGSPGSCVAQFEATRDGREAWRRLVNKYEHDGTMGKVQLQAQLIESKMADNEDPEAFFQKGERIQARLVELGEARVPDSMMLGIAVKNLPIAYRPLVDILDTIENLTYEMFKARVSTFYRRNILGYQDESKGGNQKAFSSVIPGGQPKRNKDPKPRRCYGCNETGHLIKDCKKKPREFKPWEKTTKFKPKRGLSQAKGSGGSTSGNQGGFQDELPKSSETNIAFTTMPQDLPLSENQWIVDSGCSKHMTGSARYLSNVSSHVGEILVAGGRTLKWIGSGDLTVRAKTTKGILKTVVISDVLIVPGIGPNLLAVKALKIQKVEVCFTKEQDMIKARDGNCFPIQTLHGIFVWTHETCTGRNAGDSIIYLMRSLIKPSWRICVLHEDLLFRLYGIED